MGVEEVRAFLTDFMGPADTTLAVRRAKSAEFAAAAPIPPGVTVTAAIEGGVPVEWVIPEGAGPAPVFLHLHGGGYVMGDPAGSRPFTTELALRTGARVASADYRLGPEHPFPAAVDDALAVYRSLLSEVAADAIAVGGESAGGGLTLALLLAARDAGLPMPACAVAMSPWADLACGHETYETKAQTDPLLTRAILLEMAADYLAGADPRHPRASPALGDLAGLPPLLIQVGSEEVLLGDAQVLEAAARRDGTPVTLEVWPDMIHVWHMFHAMLPQGGEAIGRVADFVGAHWTVEPRR